MTAARYAAAAVVVVVFLPVVAVVAILGGSPGATLTVLCAELSTSSAAAGSTPIIGPVPWQVADTSAAVGRIVNAYGGDTADVTDAVAHYERIGAAEGVRWDWALAQAVLETGGFRSNGWVRDRNPAGIGHYDGQSSGFGYGADAGIRAHLQLLKRYSEGNDVAVTPPDSGVRTPVAGTVRSFAQLQGTWATDPGYAAKLADVYKLVWAGSATTASTSTSTPIPVPGGAVELPDQRSLMAAYCGTADQRPGSTGGGPDVDPTGRMVMAAGIQVDGAIAAQVEALVAAAAADGVTLTGSGWRSPTRQIELRRANCGSSTYAIYEMPSGSCRPPTAKPGSSLHERGLAIDFRNCSTRSTACFQWLASNAATFGLFNLPSEPWHWSTTGS